MINDAHRVTWFWRRKNTFVREKNSLLLPKFWISWLMLYPTKMKVKVSRYCKPKSPEHAVALWSPRHQHLLNPARTDFSVRSTSLFVYLSIWSIYLSLFRLAEKYASFETSLSPWSCWTSVRGAGSLWVYGNPKFAPQHWHQIYISVLPVYLNTYKQ